MSAQTLTDYMYSITGHTPYKDVLIKVQQHMSKNHADLYSKQELTKEDTFLIKKNMENYLIEEGTNCEECSSMTELVDRLYKDMVMYSFLTDYLQPNMIEELGLEEININSWECIFIKTARQGKIRLEERFLSPQHAADVVTRMLRHSGMIIDDAKPVVLGHIAKNIRIAAFKTPVLDEEIGISASIRVVSFSKLSRHNLIREYETMPEDALEFLEACINHGVSICVAGATGSGKTGTTGYLLSTTCGDMRNRVLTVEEGSREFDLIRRDDSGKVVNDVVHLLTRPSENEQQNIDQDYLLENIMRYDPDIIGVGEMRSHEAITAAEASGTGHTVITTTHSDSAAGAYDRMVELAQKASPATEDSLYRKMVKAFPVVVYQRQLPDGSRKAVEIIEGEGYAEGVVRYHTLWKYSLEDTYEDADGKTKITGKFERAGNVSDALRLKLIENGLLRVQAEKY